MSGRTTRHQEWTGESHVLHPHRHRVPHRRTPRTIDQVKAANAIPASARRYRVSCSLCHNPVPVLTLFGETFAATGFRMSPKEQPTDTRSPIF
ncbi:MAG: hypothetical protein ACREA0_19115 [bacterium]